MRLILRPIMRLIMTLFRPNFPRLILRLILQTDYETNCDNFETKFSDTIRNLKPERLETETPHSTGTSIQTTKGGTRVRKTMLAW